MITNGKLTVYHKTLNAQTRLEEWTRYNYNDIWWFGGKGSRINKGYENANDVDIRIPYETNENAEISHFAIGDILINDEVDLSINTQQDLSNYEVYNITSINNNNFGNNPHIHLGGK